jgi:hypothetical protein
MASKSKRAKAAAPYLRRLAQDEQVQAQLRAAANLLQDAYARVRRKGGRATEDKKLYDNVREAATLVRRAAARLEPKPPPKRRGRKLAVAAAAGGTAVMIVRRRRAKSAAPRGAAPPAGLEEQQPLGAVAARGSAES